MLDRKTGKTDNRKDQEHGANHTLVSDLIYIQYTQCN